MAVTAQIGAAIPRVPAMAGQWEAVCTFPGALATPSGGFLVELVLPDGNRTDAAARASLPREAERLKSGAGPRYCIRKGLAGWILIYDWEVTTLPDDKAVYYAAQLLLEPPPTPIHATVLDNLVFGHALVENQRNLGRDDQETLARQGQVRRDWLAYYFRTLMMSLATNLVISDRDIFRPGKHRSKWSQRSLHLIPSCLLCWWSRIWRIWAASRSVRTRLRSFAAL